MHGKMTPERAERLRKMERHIRAAIREADAGGMPELAGLLLTALGAMRDGSLPELARIARDHGRRRIAAFVGEG